MQGHATREVAHRACNWRGGHTGHATRGGAHRARDRMGAHRVRDQRGSTGGTEPEGECTQKANTGLPPRLGVKGFTPLCLT